MNTALSVRMLQAVAAFVGLALILWSLGLPNIRFAEAAQVTNASDTLSDSDVGANSNHEIVFTSPNGMAIGQNFTLDFATAFDTASVVIGDVDLLIGGSDQTIGGSAAINQWGVTGLGTDTLTFETPTNTGIASSSIVTVRIGTNATGGTNQIANPGTPGSQAIDIGGTMQDSGQVRVAIVDDVVVTATVDTTFDFTVAGVTGGQAVNGTTTTGASTATTIPFGTLNAATPSTTAQDLTVTTNASNGFVVTVQHEGPFLSSTGADIDAFVDGISSTTPQTWASPSATIGSENTYGHWGFTTTDADLVTQGTDFGSNEWVGPSTTPIAVFAHDDVADGTTAGVGSARVGYQVEISSLQEAGTDYETTIFYVATPTF